MNKLITIYHGSEKIVEKPTFGEGKKSNDFGLGFYCTSSEDLAKEWAVSSLRDGFTNKYTLDTEYLKILNLNSPEYTILNWIAVLVEYRLFSMKTPVARRAKRYLIDNFSVNVSAYDLITGYRADDSYFDYAVNTCNINGNEFVKLFIASSVSKRMENGEPYSGRHYKEIFKCLTFEELEKMYYTLHEVDISEFVDIVNARIKEYFPETNLKRLRISCGCTMEDLIERG